MKGLALRGLSGEILDRTIAVDDPLLVGRAEDCNLCISDPRLSRHHARFCREAGGLFVEDLGSPNGTFVNERRIAKTNLEAGDIVVVGKTRLLVVALDGDEDDPTAAVMPAITADAISEATAASPPAASAPPEHPESLLVKPPKQALAPPLDDVGIDDYYRAIGAGDATELDVKADRLEALMKSTRNFAVLNEVSRAIQGEHDLRAMIGRVLELIATVTNADRAYAGLVDETGAVKTGIVKTRSKESGPKDRVVISKTVTEHVLRGRSAILSTDPTADERFSESASLALSDTRALLAAPILKGPRLLGLIQVENSHLRAQFTENDLDLVSVAAAMIGVAIDNLRLSEQLVHAEQLAAIGRFATGIAHEIKNQLSPFILADVIARRHPDDPKTREAAEMMQEAQQYILDLVNEIRAFASGQETEIEKVPGDLAATIERLVRLAECDAKIAKAKIQLELGARPTVPIDPKGFRQVLINLIKNAADALPESGGKIIIRLAAGETEARIDVIDDGKGIPPEIQDRIFDPFFTTKGDKGLGLGLDISRKIVTDHGGTLTFVSNPGEGTTFSLCLPMRD